jgi:hypothetical protein
LRFRRVSNNRTWRVPVPTAETVGGMQIYAETEMSPQHEM